MEPPQITAINFRNNKNNQHTRPITAKPKPKRPLTSNPRSISNNHHFMNNNNNNTTSSNISTSKQAMTNSAVVVVPVKARPLSSIKPISIQNHYGFPSQPTTYDHYSSVLHSNITNIPTHNRPNSSSKGNMDFRTIRPSSKYQDKCFNKYWESTATEPKLAFGKTGSPLNHKHDDMQVTSLSLLDRILSGDRLLYKYPHINWANKTPASFLTHVGGNEYNKSQCDTTTYYSSRPMTAVVSTCKTKTSCVNNKMPLINTNNNGNTRPFTAVNRNTKIQKHPISALPKKKLRPTTAVPDSVIEKLNNANEECYEYDNSFFNEDDNVDMGMMGITNENEYDKYKYVNDLVQNYQKLNVKTYSIKTAQADTDLLEIFDRSQRTLAATLAKVGDYEYYTSYQRIGSFMDYSMHMKWEDLKNIEKHINQTRNNMLCYQSKHNILPPERPMSLISSSKYFNDPNSMFHGLMPYEPEGERIISMKPSTASYEPIDYLPKYNNDLIFNEDIYDEEFSKLVTTSINNYNKYLISSKIRQSDLKKFNKNILKRKLSYKINFSFNGIYKALLDSNLTEIEELYYHTLKTIIMNYILRSPHERKRLNIVYYPRKTLPSSFTIAQHGSFNKTRYADWVNNYTNAFNTLESNLSLCNIAISGLIDWTRCFNHIDLVYIKHIDELRDKEINRIHIDDFCRIEESYMFKCMRFLRDVYYRGTILITKKNKVFKRKDMHTQGKWTFRGFVPDNEEYHNEYNDMSYGMNYEDQLSDFWTNIEVNDLVDIRLTPSNFGYVTYILRKQIDLNKNNYDEMTAEGKIKLNSSATAFCIVFFRKLTEKALEEFCEFFESFKSNSELLSQLTYDKEMDINFVKDIQYKDKEIKLPDLITFKISHLVNPLISLKTKYEPLYNLLKLEYTFEQVYEKIIKVIDTLCNIFNNICTTHFLEFKKILPSEREKIVKEHSSKLNEYFNSAPNQNKSFLEEYYCNLCPNLIIEEIETENYMKTYLKVIYPNELLLSEIKSKIYRKMKMQYSEIDECLKIFDPLKELITNAFDEQIKSFLDVYSAIPDYNRYTLFLEKINSFKAYIAAIPDTLQYSMFAVDTRNTKHDLNMKLENDLYLLMKSLEEEIIHLYNLNIDKYAELVKMIDVKLTTPEDVVEMEQKIKVKVASEISIIQRQNEDAYKIFIYLIKIGHLFTDDLINKTCEIMVKTKKYQNDSEKIEKMHKENRDFLENKFLNEKQEIENDIEAYIQEIDLLNFQTHINEYDNVIEMIEHLEEQIPKLEERISRNMKDEELLFDYKMEGFEMFYMGKRKLGKLGLLWRNIRDFYEERKTLIHNFSEDVDIEYYNNIFNEIDARVAMNRTGLAKGEEIVGKMTKILQDDIFNISNFLRLIHQVIESPKPLREELKREILDVLDSKTMETSCREILFNYFSRKS